MSDLERAKRLASSLVAGRMYTCHEVEDRLRRKKIDADTAEQVVSEFAAAGILNDAEYAKLYVEESVRLNYKGFYRIKQELYAKGVARSIIDKACESCSADPYAALCEYVDARNLCDGITTRKDLEKLKARLARRGYSLSEIGRCLSNYEFKLEYD